METSSVAEKNIIFRFIFTIFAFRYSFNTSSVDLCGFFTFSASTLPVSTFFFLKCDHKNFAAMWPHSTHGKITPSCTYATLLNR